MQQNHSGLNASNQAQFYRVGFKGKYSSYILLWAKNFLLCLLTFGIYWFWLVAESRQYVWSNFTFLGEKFSYHGTGKVHFHRALRTLGVFLGAYALLVWLPSKTSISASLRSVFSCVYYFTASAYASFVSFQALHQTMELTKLGQVQLRMAVIPLSFIEVNFRGILFSVFTLGFYLPYYLDELYAMTVNNTTAGSLRLNYQRSSKDLQRFGVWSCLSVILTLGIGLIFVIIELIRYQVERTWIGSSQLGAAKANVFYSTGKIASIWLAGIILILATGGLALPFVYLWWLKNIARGLVFAGIFEEAEVSQQFKFPQAQPIFEPVMYGKKWQAIMPVVLIVVFAVLYKGQLMVSRAASLAAVSATSLSAFNGKGNALSQASTLLDAAIFESKGNHKAALKAYDKILSENPRNIDALIRRANLKSKFHDLESASLDRKTAMDLVNSNLRAEPHAKAYAQRARIYESVGKYAKARLDYIEAMKIEPSNKMYSLDLQMLDLKMKYPQKRR